MVHHSLLSPGSYRAPNLAASITASFRARRLPTGGVAQPGLSWPCISSLSLRHAACRGLNATAPATATATNTLTPAAAAVLAAAASRLTAGNSNTNREEKPSTSAGQNKDISLASKQEQQRQQQGPQPQAHLEGRLLNLCLGPLPLLEQRFTVGCCPTSSALSTRPSATTQGGSNGDQQASGPGAHTFKLVAPVDVDEVMDMYIERGLMDSDPYWTRAWASAIALATTILSRPELVRGKRVADLGAGLGVAGIAAALAGAAEVVLLDREPLALQCALMSARATLGSTAQVEGLQLAAGPPTMSEPSPSPLSSSSADTLSSPSAAPSPVSLSTSAASCSQPSTQLSSWPGPIQSFAFHGPDLARYDLTPASSASKAGHHQQGQQQQQHQQEGQHAGVLPASSLQLQAAESGAHNYQQSPQQPQQHPTGSQSPQQPLHSEQQQLQQQPPQQQQQQQPLQQQQQQHHHHPTPHCTVRAASFDWNLGPGPLLDANGGARFDVVLACDVLYEEAAVEPIARLVPSILRPLDGLLLLADPPSRTAHNRERFLRLLTDIANNSDESSSSAISGISTGSASSNSSSAAGSNNSATNSAGSPPAAYSTSSRARAANLVLEECSIVDSCRVAQLDPEMAGGLAASGGAEKSEMPVPVQLVVCRSSVRGTVGLKLPGSQA